MGIIEKSPVETYIECILSSINELDNVIDNIKSNDNEEVLNLLAITLNKIEQTYPRLFN